MATTCANKFVFTRNVKAFLVSRSAVSLFVNNSLKKHILSNSVVIMYLKIKLAYIYIYIYVIT